MSSSEVVTLPKSAVLARMQHERPFCMPSRKINSILTFYKKLVTNRRLSCQKHWDTRTNSDVNERNNLQNSKTESDLCLQKVVKPLHFNIACRKHKDRKYTQKPAAVFSSLVTTKHQNLAYKNRVSTDLL